ncbi:o-succinylbenzoate synthase [Paraliobacillus quinghaiensis]|uniref:o-succinylbenzoate synthase n=1 Tax=Paraliobacillus quinghaiensis TaxID=470815 RepID=A0A917TRC5_9BACI|nr:o-succinylbenzoate synthase [Paraliobacillus quinghaiensis]GGM32911.1 o-succinylbenzoate synthase [Paraliobacillus quinghaiensis]
MLAIEKVILHHLVMDYKHPFVTSFGRVEQKDFYIIEVIDQDGYSGFGETEAFETPWYTEETSETNRHVIESFLVPLVLEEEISHPSELAQRFQKVRRNNMAKAAVESAVWDLYAKKQNKPLYQLIGGAKNAIDVGVSIGLQPSVKQLLNVIETKLAKGYTRVKLKIKPGNDVELVRAVRKAFPEIPLMVDANSAYQLSDIKTLQQLDQFNLQMIEQPLANDDFVEHASLQQQLQTPICLDESIHTYSDVQTAIALESCKIINVKMSRVGGIKNVQDIEDYAAKNGIALWCGGMLEAGVGRAHSLAIASLAQFTLPADTAASENYWERDIIQPTVQVKNGQVHLPEKPGIGYEIDREALDYFSVEKVVIEKK